MAEFTHKALRLQEKMPLIFTALSKKNAYFKMFVSKFVVEKGAVPLNPFMLFDYFLVDTVERDAVREANNSLVKRADEIWVFGQISDGVLAEIEIAQKDKKIIKYFKIVNSKTIEPIIFKKDLEFEKDVEEFKDKVKIPKKRIVICGSMRFAKKMVEAQNELTKNGFDIIVPDGINDFLEGSEFLKKRQASNWEPMEGAKRKIENNLVKGYFEEIKQGDAILIINQDKDGIKNYIGGNGFLEMGFAHVLGKKIYCLNPLPKEPTAIYQELLTMQPVILNNDLSKITF